MFFVISGEFGVFFALFGILNIRKIDFASFDCIKRPISALKQVLTFVSVQQLSFYSYVSAAIDLLTEDGFLISAYSRLVLAPIMPSRI